MKENCLIAWTHAVPMKVLATTVHLHALQSLYIRLRIYTEQWSCMLKVVVFVAAFFYVMSLAIVLSIEGDYLCVVDEYSTLYIHML